MNNELCGLSNEFKKFIDELNTGEKVEIDTIIIENKYKIIDNYIFAGYTFLSERKKDAFINYLFMLIVEEMCIEKYQERCVFSKELFKLENQSNEFIIKYERIKERIDMSYDDFRTETIKDYDYENEVLVIAFRLLRFFDINSNQLYLKIYQKPYRVFVFNDYRNNIYSCEVKEKIKDYGTYKIVKNRVEELKREVEYLNDFVLNYYENNFKEVFCITKVIFDEHNVEKNFIQGNVSFKASFKIIQKLIGPLYLNKESYGIREMIQNSVDACVKSEKKNNSIVVKYITGKDEKLPRIIIKDDGIGMNEDIILNKFLTIGESTKDDTKNIGKFGIGLLAAFLIADGLRFKTKFSKDCIYESDIINLEIVQRENAPININTIRRGEGKFEEDFVGTEIELTLKKTLIDNDKINAFKKDTEECLLNNLKEILGFKNNMQTIWYGLSEYLSMVKNEIKEFALIDSDNKIRQDNIFKYKELTEIINALKNYQFELPEEKKDKHENFETKIVYKCDDILAQMEYMQFIDAYEVLYNLNANQWYLIDNDEIKIDFYSDEHVFNYFRNFRIEEIVNKDCFGFINLVTTNRDAKIGYIWSKRCKGKVFCNNMLIPNDYRFNCDLFKVFRELPAFLVYESEGDKLEIDLARENCKLEINKVDYEFEVISKILIENLNTINNGYPQYIYPLSWTYFMSSDRTIKKVIKNKCWIEKNLNRMQRYCFILLKKKEEDYTELDKVEIINNLKGFDDCVFEFIISDFKIETTFSEIKGSDLYLAAIHNAVIYFNEKIYERVCNFSTTHLKALVLAANNIYGNVYVTTQNQLRLNNSDLTRYKIDSVYKELVQERLGDKNNINIFNYGRSITSTISGYPGQVNGIIELNLLNNTYGYKSIFEDISQIHDINIWNDFQKGIYGTSINSDEELFTVLTKEYSINEK